MARSAVQYRNCPASGLLLSVIPPDSSYTLPVVVYSSALPPFPAKTQSQGGRKQLAARYLTPMTVAMLAAGLSTDKLCNNYKK